MNIFLHFVFNGEELRTHCREAWMTLYDHTYIDEKIIGGVEKNLPNVADLLRTVEKKATGKVTSTLSMSSSMQDTSMTGANKTDVMGDTGIFSDTSRVPEKKVTQPVPFNLTKVQAKKLPEPEAIQREVKARPLPKNIYKKNLADI